MPLKFRILSAVLALAGFFLFLPFRIVSIFRKPDRGPNVKLYRAGPKGLEYWETWTDASRDHVVHEGLVGDRGRNELVPRALRSRVMEEFEQKLSDGFEEIPHSDLHEIEIVYAIDGFGAGEDLSRRHRLQAHLDEFLGWNGLGHVDGGSTGSDTMEVFALVVDPDIAERRIREELAGTEWSDFTHIEISPPQGTWADGMDEALPAL